MSNNAFFEGVASHAGKNLAENLNKARTDIGTNPPMAGSSRAGAGLAGAAAAAISGLSAAEQLRDNLAILVGNDANNDHMKNAVNSCNEIASILNPVNGRLAGGWTNVGETCTAVETKVQTLLKKLYDEITVFCEQMTSSENTESQAVATTNDASADLLSSIDF